MFQWSWNWGNVNAMGEANAAAPHPLGDHCGAEKPKTFQECQDRVAWVIRAFDEDELAMLYHHLYLLGHREQYSTAAISRLKKRFAG
jgi:hypothetical protein